jgi:hypothetical protein
LVGPSKKRLTSRYSQRRQAAVADLKRSAKPKAPMKASTIVSVVIPALLVPSIWVVGFDNDEPYVGFRASDAMVQVGVASSLVTLWVLLVIFIVAQVLKKNLHAAWLSTLLVCAIALFYLGVAPGDYLSDLVHFKVVTR